MYEDIIYSDKATLLLEKIDDHSIKCSLKNEDPVDVLRIFIKLIEGDNDLLRKNQWLVKTYLLPAIMRLSQVPSFDDSDLFNLLPVYTAIKKYLLLNTYPGVQKYFFYIAHAVGKTREAALVFKNDRPVFRGFS